MLHYAIVKIAVLLGLVGMHKIGCSLGTRLVLLVPSIIMSWKMFYLLSSPLLLLLCMSCCRAADTDAQTLASTAQPSPQPTSSHSGPLTPAQLAPCAITQQDFETAVKKVQPSVRREGFATTPDVTWSDVGSLAEVNCKDNSLSFCTMHVYLYSMLRFGF